MNLQTTREPATVTVTFAAVIGDPLAATACGLCGTETLLPLTPSADEAPCCRKCFRAKRKTSWV